MHSQLPTAQENALKSQQSMMHAQEYEYVIYFNMFGIFFLIIKTIATYKNSDKSNKKKMKAPDKKRKQDGKKWNWKMKDL